jgi:hypothetical protein
MTAAAMHIAMAIIPPLNLSGNTPRVRKVMPAPRAILRKVKAIV